MTTIAFLGTGIMGAPMARHLAEAGNDVQVWNRTRAKAQPLADQGCTVADTVADAMAGAEVLVSMLADADATESALRGVDVVMPEGALWIQMGTVGVEGTERLAALAATRGLTYVDAPVQGSRDAAEGAQLLVIAAGPDQARDRVESLLAPVGRAVRWVGPAGSASRLKLVANSWVVGMTALLGETLGLATALGVEPVTFLDAIKGGPLDSGYAQLKGAAMVARDYPTQFPAQLAGKDARLCVEAAAAVGVSLRVLDAAARQYAEAGRRGHADDDMAAVREAVVPD